MSAYVSSSQHRCVTNWECTRIFQVILVRSVETPAVLKRRRVFKTEFILDYLSQPALRTRIRRGLLKGEQLHALARCVHYGRLGPTGSARLRTPNRRGELPASHPRSYHLLADSGDRSCFERGGLGCGRSQLRVTVPYQPDRVGQRPPLRRVPAQPQSRAKRKA